MDLHMSYNFSIYWLRKHMTKSYYNFIKSLKYMFSIRIDTKTLHAFEIC